MEITRITEEAEQLEKIVAAATNPINTDLTVSIESGVLQQLSGKLAEITSTIDEAILPNDLGNTLSTLNAFLRYLIYGEMCA